MSSGERWQRIRELLEAALEHPSGERADFLDQACGSDPELRKEVESLINYRDEAERFLESPPESSGPLVGRTLSHYEVREEIGRGGMGEVYVAEDTKLHRNVALKILPREMESEERRHRFEREAQAIAALNHPNIVHVYSVEKAEGVHFITMELVHGKTLTELIPKGGMPISNPENPGRSVRWKVWVTLSRVDSSDWISYLMDDFSRAVATADCTCGASHTDT